MLGNDSNGDYSKGDDAKGRDGRVDSNASAHMTYEKDELHDYKEFEERRPMVLADKSVAYGYRSGNIRLVIYDKNGRHIFLLTEVLWVPKKKKQLISIPVLDQKKIKVTFFNGICVMEVNGKCGMKDLDILGTII